MLEARYLLEKWRDHYNKVRPHSSLNFAPPVPEALLPLQVASA
ncbi:MAG: integrase core domain-containing protein [Promethearchaeota archaeon]